MPRGRAGWLDRLRLRGYHPPPPKKGRAPTTYPDDKAGKAAQRQYEDGILVERDPESTLGRFSARLAPWDVTTVFPLAMQLWSQNLFDGLVPSLLFAQSAPCH
jgi:hypothetical protein